jgi:hypothetical protein
VTTLTQADCSRARPRLDARSQSPMDGALVDAASGETFDSVTPATPCGGVRAGSGGDHSRHTVEHCGALTTTWITC